MPLDTNETNQTISFSKTYKIKYLPFPLKNKKVNQGKGNAFTSENKQTNK